MYYTQSIFRLALPLSGKNSPCSWMVILRTHNSIQRFIVSSTAHTYLVLFLRNFGYVQSHWLTPLHILRKRAIIVTNLLAATESKRKRRAEECTLGMLSRANKMSSKLTTSVIVDKGEQ